MDETKFDHLVRTHARVVGSAIRRVCGRRHRILIPDVEQEVYLALWKRLGDGRGIDHPVSYLYKMALTTALGVIRKLAPPEVELDEEVREPPPAAPPPGELLPAERARFLGQLFERLPAEQARALRAYLAGFNHTEVAGLYGWSESVARHRIYRAIDELKKLEAREIDERRTQRRP